MTPTRDQLAEEYYKRVGDSVVISDGYDPFLAGYDAAMSSRDQEIRDYRDVLKAYEPIRITENGGWEFKVSKETQASLVLAKYPAQKDEKP